MLNMGWICLFSYHCTLCQKMRSSLIIRTLVLLVLLLFYCEWLHYIIVLLGCTWPSVRSSINTWGSSGEDIKVMILADTHLLGFREGHWFDRLRREWQMQRAFQTSMLLHQPNVVFVLGDLLDEGKWCQDEEFEYHVQRFNNIFSVPAGTQRHLVVGNHDIGYHYMITPHKKQRFDDAFGSKSVALIHIHNVIFVLLNSMAMEGDGCSLCMEAQNSLQRIAWQLSCAKNRPMAGKENQECEQFQLFQYSQPILLQHFPLYRVSDINCSTPDAAPDAEKRVLFKPRHDTLSKEATEQLFQLLEPRLVIGAHIHHGCYLTHDNGVPEWTVSSFSWRNKQNPSFLMARISKDNYRVHQCHLPNEKTVIYIYIFGLIFIIVCCFLPIRYNKMRKTS